MNMLEGALWISFIMSLLMTHEYLAKRISKKQSELERSFYEQARQYQRTT